MRHSEADIICPFPPTPNQYIFFYLNDAVHAQKNAEGDFITKPGSITVGPQISRVNLNLGKDHFMLGIIFHPGGLFRLLGMPMKHFEYTDLDSYSLFGNEISQLQEKIKEAPDWISMKNRVEDFLLRKLALLKSALPFDYAIQELVKANGLLTIEKTASLSCLSLRQFERKCMERLGLPPKHFARLIRFSKAYRLKENQHQLSWTTIAHASGYYDQMHFIRDFREFAGVTPSFMQADLEATPLRLQAMG